MNKYGIPILLIIAIILLAFGGDVLGFCNQITHPAITNNAIGESAIDDYLKNQLGMINGIQTQLRYQPDWYQTYIQYRLQRGGYSLGGNNRTVLEWLKSGSVIEDEDLDVWPPFLPSIRPRHHFHDPIRNSGLDNKTDHPNYANLFAWTTHYYPGEFDVTGQSAIVWAIKGTDPYREPTTNAQSWVDARDDFYSAITIPDPCLREYYLAATFLDLGSVAHMIEDMGVPAHARNDFLFGHYQPPASAGNDFENWVEEIVKNNGKQCPWSGSSPVVFDKLTKYFDADVYLGDYLGDGVLPPNTWGLSECSNYQFLSTSTMFGCTGTLYQFPHPAKEHLGADLIVPVPEGNKVYFNGSNYGVSHLARESYTYFVATGWGYYGPLINNTNATDDTQVFEDYANITVPRTINYATGLLNYFFRGKLSIEQTGCDGGKIQITITNKSSNSDVNQILKGGTFALYWDDSSGNRTTVSDFTVYRPGTEPEAGNEWNSSTQMNYDQTTKAVLTPPTTQDANYILVYEGIISSDPNSPDTDDTQQIATGVQKLCDTYCFPFSLFAATTVGSNWFNGCNIIDNGCGYGGYSCCVLQRPDIGLNGLVLQRTDTYNIYKVKLNGGSCDLIDTWHYESAPNTNVFFSFGLPIEADGYGNCIFARSTDSSIIKVSKISPIDGTSLWTADLPGYGLYGCLNHCLSVRADAIYLLSSDYYDYLNQSSNWLYKISHSGSYTLIDNWSQSGWWSTMHYDNNGNLWLTKQSSNPPYNYCIFKNGVEFTLTPGISAANIRSITTDELGYIYFGTVPMCQTGGDDQHCSNLWKYNALTGQLIWKRALPYNEESVPCSQLNNLATICRLRYAYGFLACITTLYPNGNFIYNSDGDKACEFGYYYDIQFVYKYSIWATGCSSSTVVCDPPESSKKRGCVQWHIVGDEGDVSGAMVAFSYSGAINGSGFATTDASGNATGFTPCSDATGTVTFTITGISKSGYNYDASMNECSSAVCGL